MGAYQTTDGIDGVALTSRAFASVIWWFPYVLSVAVLMFAISTMIHGHIMTRLLRDILWVNRKY